LAFNGSSTFSRTRIQGSRLRPYSWNTTASPSVGPVTGVSASRISPSVGWSRPAMHRSRVVLPQPDGPTTQTNCPASRWRLMFEMASTRRP
jgi:hypothetical protein